MIDLKNIQKFYQLADTKFQVIKDVQLNIQQGEFVGIVGESGSGKSTLINLIGFLDTEFEGEYLFEGQPIRALNDNECSEIRNKSVGFVFQNFSLVENVTVRENVEMPLLYAGEKSGQVVEKVQKILALVGLEGALNKYPKQLSGGQQQRVAIARALVSEPKFLIADEPTGALDSKTSEEIMALFETLHQKGVTIILVTHDMKMLRYCTRIVQIRDGEILANRKVKKGDRR